MALDESELPRLDELERRGVANAVPGLRRIGAEELHELEPHAAGIEALHSPNTGIVDFRAVARAIADELRDEGVEVATNCDFERAAPRARFAVFCVGGDSDRLAVRSGADPDPRIVPFRGTYLKLRDERRSLVRGLIYPVPDPQLPFLGVHLTRRIEGDVLVGPTALLVPGARSLRWPGTWRVARRWWRTGVTELLYAASRARLARAAAQYVPELTAADLEPAFAGVRAQAVGRDGTLVDDFVFTRTERALHVRNAPSPGATSALAIARVVADEAERGLS